jgi:hypothetical protein
MDPERSGQQGGGESTYNSGRSNDNIIKMSSGGISRSRDYDNSNIPTKHKSTTTYGMNHPSHDGRGNRGGGGRGEVEIQVIHTNIRTGK